MNSDSSSVAGESPDNNNSSGVSPNKKRRATAKHQHQQREQKSLPESLTLDMANSNGGAGRDVAGDNNNSSSNLKKLTGDLEKSSGSNSSSSTTCSKATKCLLIFSMSLIIILAALMIAIFKFNLLDNEDQCHNSNQLFQDNQFKLFSTKTTYKTAFDNIVRSIQTGDAPVIFSEEPLKSLNDRLTSADNNCKVHQLRYYGRHAARYPDRDDIDKLNKAISAIQERIRKIPVPTQTAGFVTTKTTTANPVEHSIESVSIVDNTNNNVTSSTEELICTNPLSQYNQWTSSMQPDQDNLITNSGFLETEEIAIRLKQIFPDMFNADLSGIKIHTTKAIRTAQTAIPFIRQLSNYKLSESCPTESLPSANLSSQEIRSNACLQSILNNRYKSDLDLHKQCEKFDKTPMNVGPMLPVSNFNLIAKSISKRLGTDFHLSTEEVESLYDVCKYETALLGSSIWCNLFDSKELKFYEYFDDVEDFYKDAYGDRDQASSACLIACDVVEAFNGATRGNLRPETHFHFTHSQVIRKMVAASVQLQSDNAYKNLTVVKHLRDGSVPEHRDWRTSLFTPFSANLLFTLYECNPSSSSSTRNFMVNGSGFKVVVSLNERPIKMHLCPDVICDLTAFEKSRFGKIGDGRECQMDQLCTKKYTISKTP